MKLPLSTGQDNSVGLFLTEIWHPSLPFALFKTGLVSSQDTLLDIGDLLSDEETDPMVIFDILKYDPHESLFHMFYAGAREIQSDELQLVYSSWVFRTALERNLFRRFLAQTAVPNVGAHIPELIGDCHTYKIAGRDLNDAHNFLDQYIRALFTGSIAIPIGEAASADFNPITSDIIYQFDGHKNSGYIRTPSS
jgi:hypothetical protein